MSTIKVYLSFFNLCKIIEMIVYERKESNLILQQNKSYRLPVNLRDILTTLYSLFCMLKRKIFFLYPSKFLVGAPVTEDKLTRENVCKCI